MKRKQSLIGGLDRILSVREASDLLTIPADELLKFYAGQREISLRNLLKRICRSNPIYHFPIIGETTYTLKGVMDATGKAVHGPCSSWRGTAFELGAWASIISTPNLTLTTLGERNPSCGTNGSRSSRSPASMGWISGLFCNRLQTSVSMSVQDRENSLFHVKTSRCYGREWQSNRQEG